MFGFSFVENNDVFKSWQLANQDKEIYMFYPIALGFTQTEVTEISSNIGLVVVWKEKQVVQTNA